MKKTKKLKENLSINEAQKDPEFMKEIDRFIKAANSVHKLKDLGF